MALVSASGCSKSCNGNYFTGGADLNRLKTFHVVHQPKDTHNIHNLIRDKLTKDGFTATAGPELPQSSYQADSIITYVDRWMWDITLYLLELTVTLRDTTNDFSSAVGNSFRTSLTRKSRLATEGAAKNNVAQVSSKARKLNP